MDDYATEPGDGLPAPQVSNPFLQDFADTATSGAGENPFLNFSSEQSYEQSVPVDSTNPFASFGIESIAPSVESDATVNTPAANVFTSQSSNIFAAADDATTVNLFGAVTTTPEEQSTPVVSPPQRTMAPTVMASTPPSKNGKPLPSRPPPPRPQPPAPPQPPAKNIPKDLILSVTGAMDATSNHLLDRLQATRTPSPTLIHSPSPTPEHSFADLLDVDSNVPDLIPDDAKIEPGNQDILDLFDAPNADVIATAIFSTPMTSTSTTSLIAGVPLTTAAKQDNPFASMSGETSPPMISQAQPAFAMEYPEDAVSDEKRPSMTAATPFADIETETGISAGVLDLTEPPPAEPISATAAEFFQGWLEIPLLKP